MFEIFSDSHKIIASNIHDNIFDIYGIKLNKDKLLWGSVCPDVMPKYKLIRHYKDESINYITNEIVKIIFVSRFLDFGGMLDPLPMNILSKKIGIISHYLSDFVCQPHAKRWTFYDNMLKHIKYESQLNEFAISHDFKKNVISVEDINIYENSMITLRRKIKNYINDVVEEYSIKDSFSNDLNYALSLNLKMTYFILDTIRAYSEEMESILVFE